MLWSFKIVHKTLNKIKIIIIFNVKIILVIKINKLAKINQRINTISIIY